MKNKKIWLGLIIVVFAFTATNCDIFEDAFTVSKWARGTWYLTPKSELVNIRVDKAVEITETEFIPSTALQALPGIGEHMKKKKVTVSTEKSVVFDVIEVKPGSTSSTITLGVTGMSLGEPITLYK